MKRSAFTLVEVLASMAVLMILTLALTRMFISASDITSRGMTSIARNSVGESAMESILSDLDCMVVNERVAACKVQDMVDGNFDAIYFMGTNGDADDDMPYEYFNYYVQPTIVTNSLGAVYKRYDLIKSRVIMAVGAKNQFYALLEDDKEWWEYFSELSKNQQDHEVLAENIVAFDIYCQAWDNGRDIPANETVTLHNVNTGDKTMKTWRGDAFSTASGVRYKSKGTITNMPPVSFDVKLKITSPDAAVEGGMLLAAGGEDNERRGWELLNREASTLIGRAMPMTGPSQFRLQQRAAQRSGNSDSHTANPVSHYSSED